MESKLFFKKVFLLVVIVAALFTLTACKKEAQKEDEATEAIVQPSSTPVPPETSVKEPTQEANDVSTTEYISTTNLFSLKVPDGWYSEEVLPGAGFVMANSEAALEHYKGGTALQSGDFVLNIGFLPLALLKENQFHIMKGGNTLFVGWTVPITLVPSKYILPPSCILFEGYGKLKSGKLSTIIPSGRKNEVVYNCLEAFVTFFHQASKYSGPGTEGFIETELVRTSYS